jgi:hypothetical protein
MQYLSISLCTSPPVSALNYAFAALTRSGPGRATSHTRAATLHGHRSVSPFATHPPNRCTPTSLDAFYATLQPTHLARPIRPRLFFASVASRTRVAHPCLVSALRESPSGVALAASGASRATPGCSLRGCSFGRMVSWRNYAGGALGWRSRRQGHDSGLQQK